MKAMSVLQSHIHFLEQKTSSSSRRFPNIHGSHHHHHPQQQLLRSVKTHVSTKPTKLTIDDEDKKKKSSKGEAGEFLVSRREYCDDDGDSSSWWMGVNNNNVGVGALTSIVVGLGVAVYWMFVDEESSKAMALGGPIMEEEFWDNVRRYALYALTVSTGALYTILLPIVELLKNPISAVLVVVILVGGFYIVSQVVSAMVGLSDFTYSYAY